jgi:hypothetical protein
MLDTRRVKMRELSVNEVEDVNGGLEAGACLTLTVSSGIMGGTIGAIIGGLFGPAGMLYGGVFGANTGATLASSFC